MGKYRELVSKAMDKGFAEEAWAATDKIMAQLCKRYPEYYDALICELEKLAYRIPKEQAERIVRSMSPYGQRWSLEQVRNLLKSKGITENCVNWYLVMNMVYNDNMNTASMVGMQDDENFFFSLACDFINDPDAKPFKVEKYFLD